MEKSVTLLEVVLMGNHELIDNCNHKLSASLNVALMMGEKEREKSQPPVTCVKRLILEELNQSSLEDLKALILASSVKMMAPIKGSQTRLA